MFLNNKSKIENQHVFYSTALATYNFSILLFLTFLNIWKAEPAVEVRAKRIAYFCFFKAFKKIYNIGIPIYLKIPHLVGIRILYKIQCKLFCFKYGKLVIFFKRQILSRLGKSVAKNQVLELSNKNPPKVFLIHFLRP